MGQQGVVVVVEMHGELINRQHVYHSPQVLKRYLRQRPELLLLPSLLLLLLLLLPCSASM